MRKINGYVFIAKTPRIWPMFGKSINFPQQSYENFETNNFVPFDSRVKVKKSAEEYKSKNNPLEINLAEIEMILSEDKNEFEFFKNKTNLIIASLESYDEKRLIGPWTKGIEPVTSDNIASFLSRNGYKTFDEKTRLKSLIPKTPYEKSIYALSDTQRQRHTKCLLAKLDLK